MTLSEFQTSYLIFNLNEGFIDPVILEAWLKIFEWKSEDRSSKDQKFYQEKIELAL